MNLKNQIGDGPIEPAFETQMNAIARAVDETFNGKNVAAAERKVGFILMTFNFGESGRCNYISNANREDIIVLLKQQLARFEGCPEIEGRA